MGSVAPIFSRVAYGTVGVERPVKHLQEDNDSKVSMAIWQNIHDSGICSRACAGEGYLKPFLEGIMKNPEVFK
ncbi:hypothetical protein PG994_012751 [Apiospora phragmitis]|uniref:Uncharacterized protein n=1 Tax=Apiospora phragmitis TaxID=2905665 RepID=A0ABR1TBD1_9PEZI